MMFAQSRLAIAGAAGLFFLTMVFGLVPTVTVAADKSPDVVVIPPIEKPPVLEDFLNMIPPQAVADRFTKIEGFTQRQPKDGAAATQRTVTYVAYDQKNLYLVFVAFDSEPEKIRARMTRREDIHDDDNVEVMLDSFFDRRHAYSFVCNPLGIQLDRLYTEGSNFDESFDTVWDSQGKLTPQGYVVLMAIPFRSLRFPPSGSSWGFVLQRTIPRLDESSYWPRISSRVNGILNQEGRLDGLQRISPGRNIQFVPYGVFRSFRTLDDRDPLNPVFDHKKVDARIGLESKAIVKDRVVFDLALNPDFSQVESDEPQVTVNQRFEVDFPEKRQFFLENASFFDTPVSLLYTRRIADPSITARLTGKVGPYAVAALFSDDRSSGEAVAGSDPDSGRRAYFAVARASRDIGTGTSIGVIYADREFQGEFNRVGGLDLKWKLGKNWAGNAQAVVSSTRNLDGTYSAGPAYRSYVERNSRKLIFNLGYVDNSPGFVTRAGLFQRPDIRQINSALQYSFRPEGKFLISHGPIIFQQSLWSHSGTRLEYFGYYSYEFDFNKQTNFGLLVNFEREALRPNDFAALSANRDYPINHRGFYVNTGALKWFVLGIEARWGTQTNYTPVSGAPVSARQNDVIANITLRPVNRLTIENSYLLTRLLAENAAASIFNNNIVRTKWNYQISRELSLRLIAQYSTTLADSRLTSLQTTKSFNADILVTYLLHPGTAVYVGYNSDLQNFDPSLRIDPAGNILRPNNLLINDGRQFFVKLSYLFRL